ncbi:hypothetical protein CYMTET_5657 [Cymbomonas tetramitiformis]|uniref:Uncharacterized protein n=1 Tax=Cymbomonas tetramitiformis TaxID=36881 RepID=A0AAE0GQX4_9CHLO|nr:hypothetical protein CYMTET_9709 [Cymbomonas tetramitiformis]KAK3286806.1 hypothetical protein CYMTET_5657 [Cymbomonas tetramitiformis]
MSFAAIENSATMHMGIGRTIGAMVSGAARSATISTKTIKDCFHNIRHDLRAGTFKDWLKLHEKERKLYKGKDKPMKKLFEDLCDKYTAAPCSEENTRCEEYLTFIVEHMLTAYLEDTKFNPTEKLKKWENVQHFFMCDDKSKNPKFVCNKMPQIFEKTFGKSDP